MRAAQVHYSSQRHRRRRIWRWAIRLTLLLSVALVLGTLYKVVEINQEFVANAWIIPQPDVRSARPVYPYSVVPGGVYSVDELFDVVERDPVVRKHYRGVIKEAVFRETLPQDVRAHVSYRVGNQVYWTSKVVTLKAGEQVLTDGHAVIRSRCGNLLNSDVLIPTRPPNPPDGPGEPPEIVFETKLPPLVPPPLVPPAMPTLTVANRPPLVPPAAPPTAGTPPIIPGGPIQPSVTPLQPFEPIPPIPVGPPIWPTGSRPPSHPYPPPAPVPEPASVFLLGTGLASLGIYIKRSRRSRTK